MKTTSHTDDHHAYVACGRTVQAPDCDSGQVGSTPIMRPNTNAAAAA